MKTGIISDGVGIILVAVPGLIIMFTKRGRKTPA